MSDTCILIISKSTLKIFIFKANVSFLRQNFVVNHSKLCGPSECVHQCAIEAVHSIERQALFFVFIIENFAFENVCLFHKAKKHL